VKLLTATGKVINVEVQVLRFAAIRKRILYYLSKLLWEQLRRGDAYGQIRQVIGVIICNHVLPDEGGEAGALKEAALAGRYLRSFSFRDDVTGESFTDLVKVITIELPKVPEEADQSPAWPWARFFTCRREKEFDMLAEEYPEVRNVVGVLKRLSWSEKRRALAEKAEMWRRDVQAVADDARQEGVAIGVEKGREEGRGEEKLETARRLKPMGLSTEQIAAATGLSLRDIETL
jgi:predicted transposase/invertase (TIGR01784 family)